jgi:hypothetical protein
MAKIGVRPLLLGQKRDRCFVDACIQRNSKWCSMAAKAIQNPIL